MRVLGMRGLAARSAAPALVAGLALAAPVQAQIPAGPSISWVDVVSVPTHDSGGDGAFDTYIRDDRILIDVEYSEAVAVTGDYDRVRLRLDLGSDSGTRSANRRVVKLESVLNGGRTLRFAHTVANNDTDTDGVWVQTNAQNQVVFLTGDAAITSADTGAAANQTKSGLPTAGDPGHKVDGGRTSVAGPVPSKNTAATIDGKTLTVTFDEALDASVDMDHLALALAVQGAGNISGGNRNASQHPRKISINGTELTLMLNTPARAGDTVTLTYTVGGRLRDTNGDLAPGFRDLAVTNRTAGVAGPLPQRADVAGGTLRVVFDRALDESSAPAGSAFWVLASDRDYDRRTIPGTGTASIAGDTVTLTLASAVRVDETVGVSYAKPVTSPLQDADDGDPATDPAPVLSFHNFGVETVSDAAGPAVVDGAFYYESGVAPVQSEMFLYFDEALDTNSVPAASDFEMTVFGVSGTLNPSSVAVAGNAVILTVGAEPTQSNRSNPVTYAPGTNPIQDLAGNAAAGFTWSEPQAAPGKPLLRTVRADGAILGVTFSGNVDPRSVPGPGAFALHYPLRAGETERVAYPTSITAVLANGTTLELHLANPVGPCAVAPFTVSYTKPAASPIQNFDGTDADAFSHQAVTNARSNRCVSGGASGTSGGSGTSGNVGRSLRLGFQRTLDTGRALERSAFSTAAAAGALAPAVTGAAYTAGGAGVELALDRALARGDAVTVRYAAARSGATGLWDTAGNQIADFTVEVTNDGTPSRPPSVTALEVISDAGDDGTYGLGEAIRIQVTFSEAVDVEGSPQLKIDMDPAHWGEKWASYEGGGSTERLTFSHTVVEPNESTQGIAVLADTLEANGGAIRSAATAADAELAHQGLGHDPDHKVDWRLESSPASPPSATGVAVSSSPASGDTYGPGETMRVTVTFDEAVEVTGSPRLKIDMDPAHWGEKWAWYESGGGTERLTFSHTVVEPNESTQGIAVLANTLEANGGTIRSAATGADAELAHAGLGHDPDHKVDWQQEAARANAPATGAPGISSTAQAGETLTATTDGISDADGLSGATFAFQWLSDAGGAYADISGATSSSYTLGDGDVGAAIKVRVSFADGAGNSEELTSAATARVEAPPLTAAFEGMPAEHDGERLFTFELVFSENFPGRFPHTTLRDGAFTVTNGSVRSAERVVTGENRRWRIGVRPDATDEVTITLAARSVSTESGRPLSNTVSATVAGPVGISVADARVKEGAGAVMLFAVTLSRVATSGFSVDYATSDGTARAGEDYVAASGTLSFQAGESSATVAVTVLDDAHDEGEETLTLTLSNASGAWVDDGEAVGTIENADLIPAALLARFGRATAEQVVETVEERLSAPRRRGFRARLAGREYSPGNEREFALGFLTQFAPVEPGDPAGGGASPQAMGSHTVGLGSLGAGADTTGMGGATGAAGMGGANGAAGMGGGVTGRQRPMNGADHGGPFGPLGGDLFASSGFELNRESRGGMLSVWSRSARSHFTGMEDALSLNGDVRTTMVGADWVRGPLTLGLSLGHSLGLGGYAGASGGQMSTSLTGFYPWVAYQVNDRISVWGVTGYGKGSLSLTPDGGKALETGVSMAMTAVGTRGELLGSRSGGGFSLAFKADALWVGAASALLDSSAGRLNASEAGVTRVRTALEGSRGFSLGGGRVSLMPSVEVGVRRDGGDAETGAGLDVGGGVAFADAVTGMSLDVRVRTLVVHEAEGFTERGLSLSLGWNPTPSSPLGLSARVAPSWGGSAQGGAEALWSGQMAYGMGSPGMYGSAGRLDAEVGYGLPVGARLVGTPSLGLRTSEYGRDYRAAYSLGVLERGRLHFDLGVEAQRRERRMYGGAGGAFLARATLGW